MTQLIQRNRRVGLYDEGSGEPVILLHGSSSSSRQWRRLKQDLAGRYRFLSVDLFGYGETHFPEVAAAFSIDREVSLVEMLIAQIEGPFHLVGHSYGGLVALQAALRYAERVRSIFVHEPVAFSLLRQQGFHPEYHGIQAVADGVAAKVEAGKSADGARMFVDYWNGGGAWTACPPSKQQQLAATMPKVVLDFQALFRDTETLAGYGSLAPRARVTAGSMSPPAARRVAELLGSAWGPQSFRVIDGVGHMAPVTDPATINPEIKAHLEAHPIA